MISKDEDARLRRTSICARGGTATVPIRNAKDKKGGERGNEKGMKRCCSARDVNDSKHYSVGGSRTRQFDTAGLEQVRGVGLVWRVWVEVEDAGEGERGRIRLI